MCEKELLSINERKTIYVRLPSKDHSEPQKNILLRHKKNIPNTTENGVTKFTFCKYCLQVNQATCNKSFYLSIVLLQL